MLQPIHVKRRMDWIYLAGFDKGAGAETREQISLVTEVELCAVRTSVPYGKIVAVVERAHTHLSDTNPPCLPSQHSMDLPLMLTIALILHTVMENAPSS